MATQSGNLSIHAQNIMPIIKRWLYSDKDIFIRELVSNGCDAVQKQRMLAPDSADEYRVTVTIDAKNGELRFADNGIGMTAEEVQKYINQVAFSGAEEFLKSYEGSDKSGIIGHFGLGFYSAFMVADNVTIETLSGSEGATAVHWESPDGMTFEMADGTRAERGTDIILHIAEEEKEFLQEYRVREVLTRYCGYMNTPVYLDVINEPKPVAPSDEPKADEAPEAEAAEEKVNEPERINDTPALWLKDPKECTDEEYKSFYKHMFHVYEDPLFYVHLNVDYPFNLKGILYFPKLSNDFGTREGEIKLFSGQVFVADNIKEVIPEFLMLLKGVIDCPDLPLNVSRSFLQNDGYVKKLSAYITRKVADRLTSLFNESREQYQTYWDDIHPFVKYGCMRDGKFFEAVKDTLLFKTTKGDYLTLNEYLSKNEGACGKKLYYTSDPTRQAASVALYEQKGIDVAVLDAIIDLNFMSFMEYSAGVEGLQFARVDADASAFSESPEQTDDEKKAHEDTEAALKTLFENVTGEKELTVQLRELAPDAPAALLTQDEQGRRFSEMGKIYGQDFSMPEHHTLVLNSQSPVVSKLIVREDGERRELIASQLYDLARMSTRPLEKDEIGAFLTRSAKLLSMVD